MTDRPSKDRDERPVKRSLSIAGHRTSVALEPAFWRALEAMARDRGLSLPALIARIDAERPGIRASLASALRLAALDDTRRGGAGRGGVGRGGAAPADEGAGQP
ncbi:MAG: ribbon-helix-helix domain-containing protein [Azospirillaceae bacterium]